MSWTNRSDAAAEAVGWQIIEAEAKKRKDEARAWLLDHLDNEVSQTRAVVDGVEVGKATLTHGKTEPKVIDEHEFIAWVREQYPSELVEAVNPAFQKAYFAANLHQGPDGVAIETPTGRVVPGVEFLTGSDKLTVTKSPDARRIIADLVTQGRAQLDAGLVTEHGDHVHVAIASPGGASHLVEHEPTEDQIINWNEANDYAGEDYRDDE